MSDNTINKRDTEEDAEAEPDNETDQSIGRRAKVAWSDDLSSDSEEEKERERAAREAERAAAAEMKVARADYTPQQLDQLLAYLKDSTTLYDLRDSDWNDDCSAVMKEYLFDIKKPLLCVFFVGDTLRAELGVPSVPVNDLMYFLRNSDVAFTVERFHDEVMFGNFVESVEESLMKLLEFVYAPLFFEITTWPNNVKSDFCTEIHNFLAKLTDVHFKMNGLTVIYIPREGLNITVEEASSNEDMVKRLESVVVYWTHQIKSSVEDQKSIASQYELLCPSDEYEFWVYRYENMTYLNHQIKNPAVKHITKILLTTHSTYINQFQSLCEEINQCITEAKSNVEFLQIIKEPCAKLERVTDPDEIPCHIANILNLFRVVWLESPFYNSTDKMTNLFKSLSSQVIILCSNYIDLKSLFEGNTRKAMGQFSKCIECCKNYREIYDLVSEAHNDVRSGSWNLDKGSIFNSVDSFVQRCLDMLEVCNGMIIFGRIDETEDIAKPQFGGSRGKDFETVCEKVEKLFLDALIDVEKVQDSIMKVQITSWYAEILKFRKATKNIEVILENLVNTVFEMVKNVEEGVLALFSLYNYSKRKNLKRIFKKKTTDVWQMFCDEIEDVKKDIVADRNQYPGLMQYYSGCASMLVMKKNRLKYLYQIMHEAAWMLSCSNSSNVVSQYKNLIISIDTSVKDLWHHWAGSLQEKLPSGLNRTLMIKSPGGSGFLECNLDKVILDVCAECRWWENLQQEMPPQVFHIYLKFNKINFVYQSVLGVVRGYNKILDSLSEEERALFKPLIVMCDKKIFPGRTILDWNSTITDAYITDCLTYIGDVQIFLDDYKKCNANLVLLMEEICDIRFVEFVTYNALSINDIKEKITERTVKAVRKLQSLYKDIVTYIIIVFEGFEQHIHLMASEWISYVRKYDLLLEDALRICTTETVKNLQKYLLVDETSFSAPFVKRSAILENNEIVFSPSDEEILAFADSLLPNIISIMMNIPRLHEKFALPDSGLGKFHEVIATDSEIIHRNEMLIQDIKNNLMLMIQHMEMWHRYDHIWKVDKDEFVSNFEEIKPSVEDFDDKICDYHELADMIQMFDNVSQVHVIIINVVELKKAAIRHCIEWQLKLTELLLKMTENDIDNVYSYTEEKTEELKRLPKSLDELHSFINRYEQLLREAPKIEKQFSNIKEEIETLEHFEVTIAQDIYERHSQLSNIWAAYMVTLEAAKEKLEICKINFKTELLEKAEAIKEVAKQHLEDFKKTVPLTDDTNSMDALSFLADAKEQLRLMREQEQKIQDGIGVFNLSIQESPHLMQLEKEIEALEEVWGVVRQWDESWDEYKESDFWTIETYDMEENVNNLFRNLNRLSRIHKDRKWVIIDETRTKVDAFRRTIPLLTDLKNPCMRQRHWDQIRALMGIHFNEQDPDFKLELVMKLNLQAYAEDIAELSIAATQELQIENGLKTISDIWKTTKFELAPFRDDIYKIKNVDDCNQFIEDNQVQLSAFRSTKYVEPFMTFVDYWEKTLGYVAECIENALQVQRRWLYLENIFSGEDIRKQLPKEVELFDGVTLNWTEITCKMNTGENAIEACMFSPPPYLFNKLNDMVDNLEVILRALESYLETKRQLFPRFYFISNDDMLEILGNSKRPDLVQMHLKKMFDNLVKMKLVKTLPTSKSQATGFSSDDGEVIMFRQPISLEGPAELWLSNLENAMRIILKDLMIHCRAALRKAGHDREKWIDEWPGQLGITCSKIQWTSDLIRTLSICKIVGARKPLKKLRTKQNKILAILSAMSRKDIPKILRLKVNASAVIEIHSRDTVEKMYKNNCTDVSAFDWFSQLKFFWDRERKDVMIRQTNTEFVYTYEYIGNSGRLVITPLTDRCYITLTNALNLFKGGSPQGPAGTGKTETVKDLGRALARWVVVTNCSDGLDYKSMAKCFSGIAQTGCWGCFDEFNRISLEVLSVVAQQIHSLLIALSRGLKTFVLEGAQIKLLSTGGIFITMNPGYAGRTELPDNLKSMFRPISMCVPDNLIIAENTLFSDGFQQYKLNAKKVFTLYQLAILQLSKQDHYDFGLRSMVALLRYAGAKRRLHPNLPEAEVTFLAMRDMNIARLTAKDVPLFEGIMKDLFPDVQIPILDYTMMNDAITAEMKLAGLQPIPTALHKVIQVYETKNSRHSTMVLGETNTAKSATWKILRATLIRLKKEKRPGFEYVHIYPLNPKALGLGELYGEYDLGTGEWQDGVISSIMRTVCQDETPDQKWIIFDGPVDAVWIENLNSVMDDNKLLTLINSERISLPSMVSLLFEARDLAVASPATVSRCGIVYNDYKDWGWWPYVNSWLDTFKDTLYADLLRGLFTRLLAPALDFKRQCMSEGAGITGQELTGVRSMCNLLKVMAPTLQANAGADERMEDAAESITKIWFIFCMIWSIFATLDDKSQPKFDAWLREREEVFPIKGTVYDYYVDPRLKGFQHWENKLNKSWSYNPDAGFHSILVPTIESIRVQILAVTLLQNGHGVLISGPSGTGKTAVVTGVLNAFDPDLYSQLVINMSAQTSSANFQDMIEARLEKRTKGNYVPAGGKKLVMFVDDMNMPARDEYGSQPPLEFLRQFLDYGFWFDRIKQGQKNIKDILIISAVGPPGGARSPLPSRLLSCFHTFFLPVPSQNQLVRIFGTMLTQQLVEFDEDTKAVGKIILAATIDMFNDVSAKLLPTPSKMHYLFNLRDISKIFQGLLRSNKDYHNTRHQFLRLWLHECYRVFYDRLVDSKDHEWYNNEISYILGKHFDLTFNNLCPSKEPPVFGHFLNPFAIYEDILDFEALRAFIITQLGFYNTSSGVVRMDLVLFKNAVEHLCRIVRVISQPRGNMLLVGIGGSGRQSLTRLASYICEYSSFQVSVVKNYAAKEFREDLKTLYTQCGVDNRKITFIFSDTQITQEIFAEIINNLLSSGEITNLYKADEFEDIKSNLAKSLKSAGYSSAVSNETIMSFLVSRVRANMHIAFCMSPIGEAFRNRLRQYPALINYTTTDWFLEWPREALLEVAYKYLTDVQMVVSITAEKRVWRKESVDLSTEDRLRAAVASIMSLIHSTVGKASVQLFLQQRRTNYVTPTNYLELVSGYKDTLNDKRIEIASNANKLRSGLSKIDETHDSVEVISADLEVAKIQVKEFTRQCVDCMAEIAVQQRSADEQKQWVASRSEKIAEEELQCQKLAEAAKVDLAIAMPALQAAIDALNSLNKKDLTEIKSYPTPPAGVKMVLEAVMILLGIEPTWAEAKKQLGDSDFLENLKKYDKDHITEKKMVKIATYTRREEFDPDLVGKVSTAAKSLCLWVRAIEKYGKIYRVVKPKKQKLEEVLESLRQKQLMLAEAMAKLKELADTLQRLQNEYDEKMKTKEELAQKAIHLQRMLERAEALLLGLSGERARWELTVERLDKEFDYLPGDCLMATAFISYIGPFTSNFRETLISEWIKEVKAQGVPHSAELKLRQFLLDDAVLRDWNIMGLPGDTFSAENGIIVTRATRWPLAVDPQGQALVWISNMEEHNNVSVVDFGQPDYLKLMEKALNDGLPILIQGVTEQIDPSIAPILDKAIVTIGTLKYIKFNEKMIPYNSNFRLFLCTKLGNPVYSPEVLTKTTVVNFAVKEQGLKAQLLGIVVKKEKPQLEQMKDALVMSIAKNKKTLIDLENELLRLLNESEGSLLENEELFDTLKTSGKTSLEVNEALMTSQITEVEIDKARQEYLSVAERASVLYFVLNDLPQIDLMYQFSLEAYIDLFSYSIANSKKSPNLAERISDLNEFHTYAVYKNICRSLFERHKLLFSFHMIARIQEQRGKMNMGEYMFFLKGGIVLDRSKQDEKPCKWMPDECWDNITELDKLPGFHGITESFEEYNDDWNEWYLHPEPETQPLVGAWHSICSDFQKMLFIRSLRRDRVIACVASYIVNILGPRYVEPPVLDIRAAWEESTFKSPLLFVLSPGVDPTAALIQLATDVKMLDKFQALSLGQGQSVIAQRMMATAMENGGWVFLANCHLACPWLATLRGLDSNKIHPNFRLWLSSMPDPYFPLNILQRSIKMTTEPPTGLKGNMVRLYANLNEDKFDLGTPRYRKLLFCVAFFHCSLIARKRFRELGYNIVYSFNDADFDVSEILLSNYLEQYEEVPWDAFKYLFAIINYGGHITDDWDKRVLVAYIHQFFCLEALEVLHFRLSSVPSYHIPRDGSLESYRDFVNTLPATERAESVGQHSSAEVACQAHDAGALCSTILLLVTSGAGGALESADEKVSNLLKEILEKLPKKINIEVTERTMGPDAVKPMSVCLLQELGYFNVLIDGIIGDLVELAKAIEGLVVMSELLEEIYSCIFEGKVPVVWQKARSSLKPLGSWCRELSLRGQSLSGWSVSPRNGPTLCWLPTFVAPNAFLTAVMQTTARAEQWPIDTLCWQFVVQTNDENTFVNPLIEGGVYIRSLYLEGASWFKKGGCLAEPTPMSLVCDMPVIHFKPIQQSSRRLKNRYICPAYYNPMRKGVFIVGVELPAGEEDSDFWVNRGTALLCTLAS